MARFIGYLQGRRGQASRLGDTKSGMTAQARGWDIGAQLDIEPDPKNPDSDIIHVYMDGGSHGRTSRQYCGYMVIEDGQPRFFWTRERPR